MSEPAPRYMRARNRPGMVVAAYALRLSAGLVIAAPLAIQAASWTSGRREGARAFFEPGGLFLLEALRLGRPMLATELQRTAFILLLVGYLGLLPLGALLWSLSKTGPLRISDIAKASIRYFGAFSLLLGLALSAYGIVAFVALAMVPSLLTRPGFFLPIGILLATAGIMSAIGVVHDLARAQLVLRDSPVLSALRTALGAFGWRACLAWGTRFSASAALVIVAAWAASEIGMASTAALVAVFVVHQLAIFGLVALRASWLAAAMRIASRRQDLDNGLSARAHEDSDPRQRTICTRTRGL